MNAKAICDDHSHDECMLERVRIALEDAASCCSNDLHLITIASRLAIITYYCNSQSKENSPLVRFVVPTYLTHAKQLKESLPHFVTQMTDFHVTFLRCEAASYRLLLWMRE
jgi:hypothetical protein